MSDRNPDEMFQGWRDHTPEDSPKTPMDMVADPRIQRLTKSEVTAGGPAYFFSRPVYDFTTGTRADTAEIFDLRAATSERTVALMFGSYT